MAESAPTVTSAPTNTESRPKPESGTPSSGSTGAVRSELRGLQFKDQVQMLEPRTPNGPPGGAPPAATPTGDFATQVGVWMPAVVKVTDPVAFMTSADAKGNQGKGSYAQAIADKGSKAGFFEQAKGELARIQAEITAYSGAKADLEAGQRDELARLGEMLAGYRDLYTAIQGTGMSEEGAKDPAKRAKVAQRVQAVVDATRGKVTVLSPELLGLAPLQRVATSFDEIALFVESWSDLSGDGSQSAASPYMWGAFLQTVERYRSILNQYGELEERGGDSRGTSKMAVKGGDKKGGYAKTGEQMETSAAEKGGVMALALESYSLQAESIAAYQKQVAEMQERVRKGEFATQEEAVAAFRKHVGGGAASEAFYSQLELIAKATWSASNGDKLIAQEKQKLDDTKAKYDASNKSLNAVEAHGQLAQNAYSAHTSHAEKQDKHRADAAWESCQTHRQKAEELLARSKSLLAEGDQKKQEALALHTQALAELETAKICLSQVDKERWPSLQPALSSVEGQIANAEDKLASNAEIAKQLTAQREKIKARAAEMQKAAASFDPQKIEVKAPLSEVGGEKGSLEHYQSFEIEISGKVSPIVELFGSAKGTSGKKLEGGDKLWSFAEGEWSAGVRVDLWLFELSIAYIGALRYDVLGDHDIDTVVKRGDAERARWEASKEIGAKGYDKKLAKGFDAAWKNGLAAYEPLKKLASKAAGGDKGARKDFNRQLDPAAEQVGAAQDALEEYSAGIFYDVDGFFEYIRTKLIIRDGDVLAADILALRDLSNEELPAATQDSENRFTADNRKTDGILQDRFAQMADTKNDPDVKFEASGSWEVGASAGVGGASFTVKARDTTTVSDGKEDTFNYEEEKSQTVSAEAKFKKSSVKVEAVFKEKEWELGVGGSLGFKLKGKEEEEEVTKTAISKGRVIWRALASGDSTELTKQLKDWYEKLIEDIEKKVQGPEVEWGAQHKVELDFKFKKELDEETGEWFWKSGTFGIGFATEISGGADMGVVSVEAKYTSGMKAKFVLFENASPTAKKKEELQGMNKSVAAAGAIAGTGDEEP